MRVLIYGGRDFSDHEAAFRFLDRLSEGWPRLPEDEYGNWLPDVTVISGGAKGADRIGEDWAVNNWTKLEVYKADWATYGSRAGPIRNQQMLDSGVDFAVQFPGGRGTADMRKRLDNAGVYVAEYRGEQ